MINDLIFILFTHIFFESYFFIGILYLSYNNKVRIKEIVRLITDVEKSLKSLYYVRKTVFQKFDSK